MKRLLILAAMFLCCVATTFAQFTGSGSGTENDPYLILNPIQLNQLRNFLNMEGVYFKLMANIDLTEYLEDENPDHGWQPVGSSSSAAFKGIVDGNGKTVSGLWISRGGNDNVGFFGYTTKATVKNLIIVANTIAGKDNVGGISGYSDNSTFSNVSFSGEIQGASNVGGVIGGSGDNLTMTDITASVEVSASGDYVGGLIGKNDADSNLNVSGCHINNSKISGNNYVGGACGGNVSSHMTINSLSSCYIYADVMGNERVGGICGYSENYYHTVNLNNCGFVGNVNGTTCVAGLVGYIKKTFTYLNGVNDVQNNCFAIGSVMAIGDYAGGLIGYDKGCYTRGSYYCNNVSNSYFSGTVSGHNYTAGLVGYKQYGTVSKCYATASVAGAKYVGGLVGYNEGSTTIKTSVAINTRVTATEGDVGRVVGYNLGSIPEMGATDENKSYNRTIVISQGVAQDIVDNQQNGTGVSKTTLKLKATYVAMGWDFTSSWDIQETECYPYFKTQTAPPVITSQLVSRATTVSGKCVDGGTVTLEVDGTKQQMVSTGHLFSFTVSPLQAGHDVRLSAKADGKEPSYFTTETVSYLGKGTESDPYQIYTAADLTGVYRKGYFKLMNDIDLTDYINQFSPTEGWESIGREGSETIHFDGNGKKITGLWCNSTRDNTGLFSCFANGEIKNLTVETASGKQVKGGANTGILIGKMINGSIVNCNVSGKVADGTPVGGLVGLFTGGSISRCQAAVTITTTGATSYVGGIVGEISGGTIDQCVTTGTLTGIGDESYVGGMVGKNYATITNCYSTTNITSSYNAAGIVAYNYSLVDKCLYTGNLYSNNYAAGIIGYNDGENAVVQNSVATSNKIEVVYESQQVQQGGGYGQRIIGGIKNNAPAPEMNNYALKTMQVSLNDVPQKVYDDIMNGVAKTSTELKQKATFQTLGWNFDGVWSIDEDSSYPYQTVKVEGGSDPVNPDPQNPDPQNPDPQTQVEVTDVTDMANAIYVEPLKGSAGTDVNIEVKMKNANLATSYGFELVLPAGVTINATTDGEFDDAVTMSARHKGHSLTTNKLANNTYKVGVASLSSKAMTGNDGLVLTIQAHVDANIAEGEYAIGVQSPLIVYTDGTKPAVQSTQSKITIEDYTKGDVDGDGVIDLADAVLVINHYVGKQVVTFIDKAADVDGDGVIDLADAVLIINYYVGKIPSLARSIEDNGPEGLDPQ
jgi:hypothetical protein